MICTSCGEDETKTTFYKALSGYRQPCSTCLNLSAREKRAVGQAFEREIFSQDGGYYSDNTPALLKMMRPTKL